MRGVCLFSPIILCKYCPLWFKRVFMVLKRIYIIKRSLYLYNIKNFILYPTWNITNTPSYKYNGLIVSHGIVGSKRQTPPSRDQINSHTKGEDQLRYYFVTARPQSDIIWWMTSLFILYIFSPIMFLWFFREHNQKLREVFESFAIVTILFFWSTDCWVLMHLVDIWCWLSNHNKNLVFFFFLLSVYAWFCLTLYNSSSFL